MNSWYNEGSKRSSRAIRLAGNASQWKGVPMTTPNDTTKRCPHCKLDLPATLEYFNRNKSNKISGLSSWCRLCTTGAVPKQQLLPGFKRCTECQTVFDATDEYFYRDPRGKRDPFYPCCKSCFLGRAKKSREKDVEKTRKYALAKYYEHHEDRLSYGKKYREEHADKVKAKNKRWAKNNPDKVRARTLRRVARRKGAEGTHTAEDVLALYEEQCGRCAYCGITLYDQYHVDHVIPLDKGGSDWPENLLLACPFCNCSKANKMLEEWMKVRGW